MDIRPIGVYTIHGHNLYIHRIHLFIVDVDAGRIRYSKVESFETQVLVGSALALISSGYAVWLSH